jgi:NAD(P)-dependent dehydrogenase (short-subunit alcohol dehydrogenase family)
VNILLTGGGRGIGLAVLRKLAAALPDSPIWVLGQTAPAGSAGIPAGRVDFRSVDLTEVDAAQSAFDGVLRDSGGIDVLVNNAGWGKFAPAENLAPADWARMMTLNATVPFLAIRTFLPGMKARKRGRIINISSDADSTGFAGATAYCASKHALKGMVRALRKELKGTEVGVSLISPGRVDTFFNNKCPGQRPNALHADDVADVVLAITALPARCEISCVEMESVLE